MASDPARLFPSEISDGFGPFRVLVTGKVGFANFEVNNNNATAGLTSSVGLGNGTTRFAIYPAGGFEAFAAPSGVRAEVGDDIYFLNGAHNNLQMGWGPQFRF